MNQTTLVLFALAALAVVATPVASADVEDLKDNAADLVEFVTNPYYPNCYTLPVGIEDPHPATHLGNAGTFCWAP